MTDGRVPLSEAEFQLFRALLEETTGVALSDAKRGLLSGRLQARLRQLAIGSFAEYLRRVRQDPDEQRQLIESLLTHQTELFRERRHFDRVQREYFPRWTSEGEASRRPRHIRALSAGCSTGEEAWSLALWLRAAFPERRGWQVSVLGLDLSESVLQRARRPRWTEAQIAAVPDTLAGELVRDRDAFVPTELLQRIVQFRSANLTQPLPPAIGRFDLIFCRNVLIYFAPATRVSVVRGLCKQLDPRGVLVLGHSEGSLAIPELLEKRGHSIFELKGRS